MANILHWLQFAVGLAPWLGYSKIQYVAYGFRKPAFGNLSAVDFGPFSKEILETGWLAGWLLETGCAPQARKKSPVRRRSDICHSVFVQCCLLTIYPGLGSKARGIDGLYPAVQSVQAEKHWKGPR